MYRPGDFYRICERTGFKVRASQTAKEWTGRIVRTQSFEERHPQDFVRAVRDGRPVRDSRPEPVSRRIGPLVALIATDGASAGETTIKVVSSSGMTAGDSVRVTHEGGTLATTLAAVPNSASVTLSRQLPNDAPPNATITDLSVVALATHGF